MTMDPPKEGDRRVVLQERRGKQWETVKVLRGHDSVTSASQAAGKIAAKLFDNDDKGV